MDGPINALEPSEQAIIYGLITAFASKNPASVKTMAGHLLKLIEGREEVKPKRSFYETRDVLLKEAEQNEQPENGGEQSNGLSD